MFITSDPDQLVQSIESYNLELKKQFIKKTLSPSCKHATVCGSDGFIQSLTF